MSAGAVFLAVIWFLVLFLVISAWRVARRRVTPGTALLSSMDRLFGDDRRAAVELIVEERTGHRDPEDKDGDLPQLETAGRDG